MHVCFVRARPFHFFMLRSDALISTRSSQFWIVMYTCADSELQAHSMCWLVRPHAHVHTHTRTHTHPLCPHALRFTQCESIAQCATSQTLAHRHDQHCAPAARGSADPNPCARASRFCTSFSYHWSSWHGRTESALSGQSYSLSCRARHCKLVLARLAPFRPHTRFDATCPGVCCI